MRLTLSRLTLLGVFVLAAAHTACAQTLTPDAEKAMQQGRAFETHGELTSALASFRNAAKLSNDAPTALEALARINAATGDLHAANATIERLNSAATTPAEHSQAWLLGAGLAYGAWRDRSRATGNGKAAAPKESDALLAAAARDAQSSVEADPANEPARALLARVLAAENKGSEASREFTACAANTSAGQAECDRNKRLAANLESARHAQAPVFAATTLEGKPVSLESLAGKVVLLDFWATWCVYCHRDSDYVQSLLDTFPPDKFVLLEVNVEDDPELVRRYIEDNRLDGVQVQDAHKRLQTAFGVTGFPTYVILDDNGSERLRATGIEGDLRGTVRTLLAESNAASNR